jgi:hypothetical protein
MESGLIWYALFAVTTAITGCVVLLKPSLNMIAEVQPLNPLVQAPALAYMVFFLVSLLFAPLLPIAMFISASNDKFKNAFVKAVLE